MKPKPKTVRVKAAYLKALEELAKIAEEDLEWMVDINEHYTVCPWCACTKDDGHDSCPFGRAIAKVRRERGKG